MWVPLHVHSQYSILDSTISLSSLCAKASKHQFSSVALTDSGNLFGIIDFYKCAKALNINPIIGCEMILAPGSCREKKKMGDQPNGTSLVLLAKNKKGYQNLCKLSSLGYTEGFYYTPRIDKELLEAHSEGLVCLSGPITGKLGYLILKEREEELISEVDWFSKVFKDDFYFEVQRHPMSADQISEDGLLNEEWLHQSYQRLREDEEKVIRKLRELSIRKGIPLVATNDSHYLEREDWKAHEILMNIQTGEPCEIWERDSQGNPKVKVLNPKRKALASHEYDFKSQEAMKVLFHDIPEALQETLNIAEKCHVELDFKTKYYPVFVPPGLENVSMDKEERMQAAATFLEKLCRDGVALLYTSERLEKVKEKYPQSDPLEVVHKRLSYELDLIISKGMCDYLLIVYDFIAWAKKNKIPVGPGRGSGAGSIVLYLIGITDIEPLRFNLFFERFINPKRLSYPDIDVDICMERRDEVIDYVVSKYGKDKVAQIITFGTMKARMAVKDVGRVLNVPLSKVNQIVKLIPEDLNITLDKALEIDPELRKLYETDEEVQQVLDLGRKLEGSIRNSGIHAAGLIISGDPLTDRIPVCTAKDAEMLVTQYAMKPVEAVGMLKIDFLGLKTLTSIQKAVDAIEQTLGKKIDWVNLPLDDKATFSLLNQGTLGLFQLESGGMQELVRQLHISVFPEIIAVGALYRPGPMEMIPSFINRKHGKEPIDIDHPLMKDILEETYGIMVYQEQVMQIASLLAGYSLGEGDVLRRAMGKKDREEMANQREKFRKGAIQNGIDEDTAIRIFDKVEKFASYGFNKSHAAAYGYLTYVTAYLKANFPGFWMAALLTCDRDDVTKIAKFIAECQAMGIPVLPPDVNEAGKEFTSTKNGIRFAMTAIKGIGEGAVDAILEERSKGGHFDSLYDFIKRVDHKKVGQKVIELLVESGAFDWTKWSRQQLLLSVNGMIEVAIRAQKEEQLGVLNLFSLMEEGGEEKGFINPPPISLETPLEQILKREKELLGFYITGHPMNPYRVSMKTLSCVSFDCFSLLDHDAVIRTAFIIENVHVKIANKSQRKFAILIISDGFARHELPIWPELYEEKSSLIQENQLIYAILHVDKKEGDLKFNCKWIGDLTKVDDVMIKDCDLFFEKTKIQIQNNQYKERAQSKARPPKKEKMSKLKVSLNASLARLSHILEIKKILREHPGSTALDLCFYKGGKKVGTVIIDSSWGVELGKEIQEKLKQISSIQTIEEGE